MSDTVKSKLIIFSIGLAVFTGRTELGLHAESYPSSPAAFASERESDRGYKDYKKGKALVYDDRDRKSVV